MNNNIKRCLIIGTFISILAYLYYFYFPWVILPVKSSPQMLTLVQYGGPYLNKVKLSHYINGVHIDDYVLDLKVAVRHQMPQHHELPQLNEGTVEVSIEAKDSNDGHYFSIKIPRKDVNDLYKKGLLIYLMDDSDTSITINGFVWHDQYVYFISGDDKICYYEKGNTSEWSLVTDTYPPIFTKEEITYSRAYYGWKENKWAVLPAKS